MIYPGANVEEVEEGVSRKIEEAIDGLEGVKRYATFSAENVSTAQIEIKERFSMAKARDLIENAIASISNVSSRRGTPCCYRDRSASRGSHSHTLGEYE